MQLAQQLGGQNPQQDKSGTSIALKRELFVHEQVAEEGSEYRLKCEDQTGAGRCSVLLGNRLQDEPAGTAKDPQSQNSDPARKGGRQRRRLEDSG